MPNRQQPDYVPPSSSYERIMAERPSEREYRWWAGVIWAANLAALFIIAAVWIIALGAAGPRPTTVPTPTPAPVGTPR